MEQQFRVKFDSSLRNRIENKKEGNKELQSNMDKYIYYYYTTVRLEIWESSTSSGDFELFYKLGPSGPLASMN